MSYTVTFENDMGHLVIGEKDLPREIVSFCYEKIANKYVLATDNKHIGARYYILKPGLASKWTYTYNGNQASRSSFRGRKFIGKMIRNFLPRKDRVSVILVKTRGA